MGPLMGYLLDRSPGYGGHQDLFFVLAGISVLGLIAAYTFNKINRNRSVNPEMVKQ